MNILNIFVKHYNTAHNTAINLFHGIDAVTDTNEIMEELMDHIAQYKQADVDEQKMYAPDISLAHCEVYYGLFVNQTLICICPLLYPLLEYIDQNIDWVEVAWQITQLTPEC
jgi:hypothetical protein